MYSLDTVFSSYLANVNLNLNYEKVNSTYAEALIATLLFVFFLRYKWKYWSWQGVPNDLGSVYNRFSTPFHVADQESYKKYGKVVGLVVVT